MSMLKRMVERSKTKQAHGGYAGIKAFQHIDIQMSFARSEQ